MTYSTIQLTTGDGLATITLNQPDKLNAVSRRMIAELKECWESLADDTSVRRCVATAASGSATTVEVASVCASFASRPSAASSFFSDDCIAESNGDEPSRH